ncbi:hypothetical protein BN14_09253 [Rhizoctonia solani AG-1 IB]|uniref:Uncharacterized protein n=1 Tax=Thanatephorus cucumeris (strain AG1-IB / isolate 7/3/14) TaxID=1108050 RepID=M5C5B1_THACB|nr:hypothetical protein BN14_09253 [Rhizoctonia solani AG-1 IB]
MHTRQQKRKLEDPAPTDPSTASPNTILPASLANPTPANLAPPPTADVPSATSGEQAVAPKPPKKKSAKKGTTKTTPANEPTESQNDATRKAIPTDNTQPPSQRRIIPSLAAQQAALQDAIENDKKAAKAKKKATSMVFVLYKNPTCSGALRSGVSAMGFSPI